MKYYYADENNQPVGPYSLEELNQFAFNGKIQPSTWVVEEGGTEWKSYDEVKAAQVTAVPAPAPAAAPKPTPSAQPQAEAKPQRTLNPQPAKMAGGTPEVTLAATPAVGGPREGSVSIVWAIIWFLLCFPIGFMMWGQSGKGWLWLLIGMLTGVGVVVAWIDYWMNWAAQTKRQVGPWEWFPSS